ncbi:MAG: sodium-extruding oxaloacetate decarboxylase subunit alpha [Calditrichia bacterium]
MAKLKIRDVTLRDGQQSLFATRMTREQIDRVLSDFKVAGFYAMEVWGGAVPDATMRYLNENPWERLSHIRQTLGNSVKLTALSRGRNLFGYNPYPQSVIEGFNRNAIQSGIDIMRIFDALNDVENMKSTISVVKENGGLADCAVCYTVDSSLSPKEKLKYTLQGKSVPDRIFDIRYFVENAKKLEDLGADIITIKDMAGLITPERTAELIKSLKRHITVPINFHTHCTPGYGLASTLMAIVKGVDIVDTAILNFSGGPAAPSYELIQIFADKLGLDTGVNREVVSKINRKLGKIRRELAAFDTSGQFPIPFDFASDRLSPEVEELFDMAIDQARREDFNKLLKTVQTIEQHFNLPAPNETVRKAQIPGGMYTNMLAQLRQLNLEKHLDAVLKIVPKVRLDAGIPPLVTPTSQIVGAQAVNLIVDQANGKPFYTTKSTQFVNLVKGKYGKTPWPVDPKFREKICGHAEEVAFDESDYQAPENQVLEEYGGVELAQNEKEMLLLELFPAVAVGFLKKQREAEYMKVEEEKRLAELKETEKQIAELSRALTGNYLDESILTEVF